MTKFGKILVGNLACDTEESSIRELFEQTEGTIVSVDLAVDKKNGKGRGYALVEMSTQLETSQAIQNLNGAEINGRRVNMSLSEEGPKPKKRLFLFSF
jgi:RNA recognition motif-containing protein